MKPRLFAVLAVASALGGVALAWVVHRLIDYYIGGFLDFVFWLTHN